MLQHHDSFCMHSDMMEKKCFPQRIQHLVGRLPNILDRKDKFDIGL